MPYDTYLYDSVNVKQPDSSFVFELKQIVLPQVVDTTHSETVYSQPSFLTTTHGEAVKIEPQLRVEADYDFLTGLFIFCLLLLTWVRYEGQRRVLQLFKAVVARYNVNQLMREGNLLTERITPALMFIYVISLGTLVINLMGSWSFNIPGAETELSVFSIVAGLIIILWGLKLGMIKLAGIIFRTTIETEEYILTNLIYNIVSGLAALPFVIIGHYNHSREIIIISLGIFMLGVVFRFSRSIFVGLSAQTFPVVYLFLYLCTLEILPILVIYKFIM